MAQEQNVALPGGTSSWARWRLRKPRNINEHYDGHKRWNGRWYRAPPEVSLPTENDPPQHHNRRIFGIKYSKPTRHVYRNILGKECSKPRDVETYPSPAQHKARRLRVQVTDEIWTSNDSDPRTWIQVKMKRDVPKSLKLAEWALGPTYARPDKDGNLPHKPKSLYFMQALKSILVSVPLEIVLTLSPLLPPWGGNDVEDDYPAVQTTLWTWPEIAVNELDARPPDPQSTEVEPSAGGAAGSSTNGEIETATEEDARSSTEEAAEPSAGEYLVWEKRLLLPRLLVARQGDDTWVVEKTKNYRVGPPYIFISFTNELLSTVKGSKGWRESRLRLESIAESLALREDCSHYWIDFKCCAEEEGDKKDEDVNRFCDVIRGAQKVIIVLPGDKDLHEELQTWGSRMWCLPEGLLTSGNQVHFYTYKTDQLTTRSKLQMTADVWKDSIEAAASFQSIRRLAEHFSGVLTLSRLELFPVAVNALAYLDKLNKALKEQQAKERQQREQPSIEQQADNQRASRPEVAYALMGLLNHRLDPRSNTETVFQSLARLSLLNDNDRLIERMACLLPNWKEADDQDPFRLLAHEDQYGTRLHQVEPSCNIVGIAAEDYTVILDGCRAIPIRWKGFPKIAYERTHGLKKDLAELSLQAGTVLSALGIPGNPFSAISVRRLYGGTVLRCSPILVGFEGVMPISDLEKMVFGNDNYRLKYHPSATRFIADDRNKDFREGNEPKWVTNRDEEKPALSDKHKLFTLVNFGDLSVSIFEALRPPTVALICGRDGGMLRTVLCTHDFASNTHHKETVIRMSSVIEDLARNYGWLKLCLSNPQSRAW